MYQELNDKQSRTEKILIAELVNLGYHPKPQHKISKMHVDIALPEYKLVIEVDNPLYHNKETDRKRDEILNKKGWTVLRFDAHRVHTYAKIVAKEIEEQVNHQKREKKDSIKIKEEPEYKTPSVEIYNAGIPHKRKDINLQEGDRPLLDIDKIILGIKENPIHSIALLIMLGVIVYLILIFSKVIK